MSREIDANSNIVVWFSSGAASAVAAKITVQKYGEKANVRVVNNPIAEEHPDNRRFLMDVEKWIGRTIETASNPKYPSNSAVDVWNQRKFMSGPTGAVCTVELKKRARQHFEAINKIHWHVLGFTLEERQRSDRFMLTERPNVIPVLIDESVTKQNCINILLRAGVKPPIMYDLGYPNANCIGCVKATSPTYWNHVRRTHPDVFECRAEQSRGLGVKLARFQGRRVFLDELPPTARGRPMKSIGLECGIFCEEPG